MTTKQLLPGLDVSRETENCLHEFAARLQVWTKTINLVSSADFNEIWSRHILDSAQIWNHVPAQPGTWLDLGSGGGLPGIVCAIIAKERAPKTRFTLVESDGRKVVFLSETSRILGLNTQTERCRIEALPPVKADIITARALAPLPKLLHLAAPFCHPQTTLLFHKGKTSSEELTAASQTWHIHADALPSKIDSGGVILKITGVKER